MYALSPPLTRIAAAGSMLALAGAGLAFGATSASAALTTHCDGEATDVTVPGDLVVAQGDSCVLDGVTVEGQVRIMSGADLIVSGSSLEDQVIVNTDGFFDATDSTVGGSLVNRRGYGVYLDGGSVGGAFLGRDGEADTFVFAYDVGFDGRVQAENGSVYLESSHVDGHMETENNLYTDVVDSTLNRSLSVSGTESGSAICASEVHGEAALSGNHGVQIGTGDALLTCDATNYFGGDLIIDDNTGSVDVSDNIIRGDLTGEGNDPAPSGDDNRVRGEVGGQFTELETAPQEMSALSSSEARAEQLTERREQRHGEANEAAQEAGPASL